jgi:hypothetical protein
MPAASICCDRVVERRHGLRPSPPRRSAPTPDADKNTRTGAGSRSPGTYRRSSFACSVTSALSSDERPVVAHAHPSEFSPTTRPVSPEGRSTGSSGSKIRIGRAYDTLIPERSTRIVTTRALPGAIRAGLLGALADRARGRRPRA